jgi:RNA polymerase sigma factor (sigma-70 family)
MGGRNPDAAAIPPACRILERACPARISSLFPVVFPDVATVVREASRDRAFEQLYERHVKDVYRYALAVMRNPADAEDVTQTTFMNAYRAFKAGEDPIKPQNWLIKIAHNACRTRAIRASRRPREVPLDDNSRDLAALETDRPDVKALLRALGELPFNQRSALVMRELEGRTYEEIAETLDVSVPAVETLIFRARRSLRVRRDALRGLFLVPLPESLHGFFGSGAAATGGIAIGSGVAVKAAAVVAALVAGGVGYEAVDATAHGHHARHSQQPILVFGAVHIPEGGTSTAKRAAPVSVAGTIRTRRNAHRSVPHRAGPTSATIANPAATPTSPGPTSAPASDPVQPTAAPASPRPSGDPARPKRRRPGSGPVRVLPPAPVALPALPPVSTLVPTAPALPPVPALPAVPALPTTPALPTAPALPTTPALPPPPALPAAPALTVPAVTPPTPPPPPEPPLPRLP